MKNREMFLTKQKGVVLIVSMVMLLLLTLIGITGSGVTSLEERMAGNARDQNIAFQAAESTLLAAEQFVLATDSGPLTYSETPSSPTPSSGKNGLLGLAIDEPNFFLSASWTSANSAATPTGFGSNFTNNIGVAINDPRYIIKKIANIPPSGAVGPKTVFRITARAIGHNPGTQVVLQEIFERTN